MKILLFIFLLILNTSAVAGGTSIPVKMLEMNEKSENQYELIFLTLDTEDYELETYIPKNTKITVRLKFDAKRYLSDKYLSREQYQEAIGLLKLQVGKGDVSRFGRMGGGVCEVNRKSHIYSSDALKIYDEELRNGNVEKVVYSYCKYK